MNEQLHWAFYESCQASILEVLVATNGEQGGDAGHGCKTLLELRYDGTNDVNFQVSNDGVYLRIAMGGDSELRTLIECLQFAADSLRNKCLPAPMRIPPEVDNTEPHYGKLETDPLMTNVLCMPAVTSEISHRPLTRAEKRQMRKHE